MDQDIVAEGVINIFKRYVTKNVVITPETDIDTLSIDSLTFIEILFELEKHFNVRIPDRIDTINSEFRTIAVIIEAVHNAPSGPVDISDNA